MKKMSRVAFWVSRIAEIVHWIGTAFAAGLLICSLTARGWLIALYEKGILTIDGSASSYGLDFELLDTAGKMNVTAITMFAIGAVLILPLYAMIFRSVSRIAQTSSVPFNTDNIRRIRRIGIFSILVPVVGLLISIVARIVIGNDLTEISVRMDGVIMGILVLFLTQIFTHGARLEEDVDGLL